MSFKIKATTLFTRLGSYLCTHFVLKEGAQTKTKGCCSRTASKEPVPICRMTNQICPGLPQCPRLDVQTKANLIKTWNQQRKTGKYPDPSRFLSK